MLEAQISGLPCIVSDKVTKEVDLGDINWQSINDDPRKWADVILSVEYRSEEERTAYRKKHLEGIQRYDITQSVKQLDRIYTDMLNA